MLNLLLFLCGLRQRQTLPNNIFKYHVLFILGASAGFNRRLFNWRVNSRAHNENKQVNTITFSLMDESQTINFLNLFRCLEKFFTTCLNNFQQDRDIMHVPKKKPTFFAIDIILYFLCRPLKQISLHSIVENKRTTCSGYLLRRTDHETYPASGKDSKARLIALSSCSGVISIQLFG
jgi:hypothetical protein